MLLKVKVTDVRSQNLVKLSGGEYIALEVCLLTMPQAKLTFKQRLEAAYKANQLVSNIMVHATSDAKQPIAVRVW